ncbi:MAG TPA: DUF1800 domain-containing protein [Propionicimonas sp.]|nr:DUF1800 domain-containing protein [Propionicimonas sp.]HRA05316.1 DUF1800 domain-containing protein [Propionicimonas sp.]
MTLPSRPLPEAAGAASPAPQPSRRAALGLAIGGGLALSGLGDQLATAGPGGPGLAQAPVLPAKVSDLAGGLNLQSTPAWHLARRVAPAATKPVAQQIAAVGTKKWIKRQLNPKKIKDAKADKLIRKYLSYANMTGHQVYLATDDNSYRAAKALSVSRTVRQVFTERHLYESMVDTMSDHLYISADSKASDLVAWFDWSVLRKHALGKYSRMLTAAITHPAMLVYLDNNLNSKDSPNENLGRELLELHTVGPGNYDETDVRQSALLLTGHGFDWKTHTYRYTPAEHHVGPLKIMDFSHPNASAAGGPAVLAAYLNHLAHQRGTATHIARRLAVRYVSDEPSEALVARLAQVYLDNDTSLAAVMRALLLSGEFAASVGQKWRRPQETMAVMVKARKPSTLKPKGKQSKNVWAIAGTVGWLLELENHQPRYWPVVDGYPDDAAAWMSTQALLAHWNSANARTNWGDDPEWPSKSWRKALGITVGMDVTSAARRITTDLTGYTWPDRHLSVVAARLKGTSATTKLTADQLKYNLNPALHYVFSSPYFMLR